MPQISAQGLPSKQGMHSEDAEDIAALIPAVHSPSRLSPAVLQSGPHTVSQACQMILQCLTPPVLTCAHPGCLCSTSGQPSTVALAEIHTG